MLQEFIFDSDRTVVDLDEVLLLQVAFDVQVTETERLHYINYQFKNGAGQATLRFKEDERDIAVQRFTEAQNYLKSKKELGRQLLC